MTERSERRILGIDIGGTKIALCVVAHEKPHVLLDRERVPTQPSGDPARDLAHIVESARTLLERSGTPPESLAAIGVSAPGPLDRATGLLVRPPNLPGWAEVPLGPELSRALGAPTYIDNDANAGAVAEWRFGAGRGFRHLVYLTMSTGIGGGLILDGRVHRGYRDFAGEVGHVPVEWEGEPCNCGMRGCLEAYAGGAAWQVRLRAIAPAESRVVALAGGREQATPRHVVAAAKEGDAFALAELDRFNDYVARAIVQLAFSLAPEVVVLGTIAVAAGEELCLAPVRERVRSHAWAHLVESLEIRSAELGDELADYAGLSPALEALEGAG